TESESGDDCIQCPFHGWRFGGDGQCKRIPNHQDSELKAIKPVVKKWPTIERNELIYVWHHSEGSEPDHYPEDFVAKYGHKLSLKCSITRLMDSNHDLCHVSPVLIALFIGEDDSMLGPFLSLAATVPLGHGQTLLKTFVYRKPTMLNKLYAIAVHYMIKLQVEADMVIWVNFQKQSTRYLPATTN
ncbi:unnamed protein product, partial [Medioppia subpectinata]